MKNRLIGSIIMIAIGVPILLMGGIFYTLLVLSIGLLGIKEMIEIRESKDPIPLMMKLITFGLFIFYVTFGADFSNNKYFIDYYLFSLFIFTLLLPIIIYRDNRVYNINDAFYLMGVLLLIGTAFNILNVLRAEDLMLVIYLLVIAFVTDTYAYIGGNLIGKNKLIESISPKKTWEGLFSGTFFGTLIGSVVYYITINDSIDLWYIIICTTLLSLYGQFGDIIFSSIKRLYYKKDFSNLIPGHGGILDRIDNLIFVVIGYVMLIHIL